MVSFHAPPSHHDHVPRDIDIVRSQQDSSFNMATASANTANGVQALLMMREEATSGRRQPPPCTVPVPVPQPQQQVQELTINIIFRDQSGGKVHFKAKRTNRFKTMMDAYYALKGMMLDLNSS